LSRGKRLIEMHAPGEYGIEALFTKQTPTLTDAVSFLMQLSQPRVYSTTVLARGENDKEELTDSGYFEALWRRLVLESEEQVSTVSAGDLLAAAAWYSQQEQKARVAFILERLNTLKVGENEFYRQMRMESLRGIRLVEINQELETTRRQIAIGHTTLRYKALLIGINTYAHPAWQPLKNPVSDIRALKNVLISNYRFNADDITLLENASYDDIIEAFNQLKRFAGEDTSLLVYYAGHGYYPKDEGEGYWIPRDAGEPESLRLFLPTSTVLSKIHSIKTRHTLLIADSCFSGSLVRKTRGSESNSRFYQDLSQKKSRQIITSGGLEPVDDQGAGRHSIFAGKLIQILTQERQEPLSASELAFNLRKEVKNAWGEQTPEYGRLQIEDDENGEFFFVQLDEQPPSPVLEPPQKSPRAAVPVLPSPKTHTFADLPRGVCLAPKPFTDLRHCSFRFKKINDVNLAGANLEGVDFKYVTANELNLEGANLAKTDWRYSNLNEIQADRSLAQDSDWRYTRINDCDLSQSNLRNADFRYANLNDIKLDNADLTGADIRYATLEDVSLEGANLTDVRSSSNDLFGERIEGIVSGLAGAIAARENEDSNTDQEQSISGSWTNRGESVLYLGIKPFSAGLPNQNLRPVNLGFHLGGRTLLGAEFGNAKATGESSSYDAEASLTTKGIFARFYSEGSFNTMLALNQLTWSGEATAYTASGSEQGMKVTASETVTIATIALGNQWLLDSGITIGCDWALFSVKVGDTVSSYKVSDKGGTAAETGQANDQLSKLQDELLKDTLFSERRSHFFTVSIGYSF
jgi:uncharacterized protein YjbI with pentapeptide repeats